MIYRYMDSKATEYAMFDPKRAQRLFCLLRAHLQLHSFNIHIIGTNGKGSTGRFIAQSIAESKRSVVHFTSPHIFEFRERFYKNGEIVGLKELEDAHVFLQQFDFMHEASYFEYATFLALVLARECEFLIMEAGVGGEYDSTSVLSYDITVFTRIGIDHKEMLGDSLESIALTKLRAAQGEIFVHFQEQEVLKLFCDLHGIVAGSWSCKDLKNGCQKQAIKHVRYLSKHDRMQSDIQEYVRKYEIPIFLQENLTLASLVLQKIKISPLQAKLDLRGRCEIVNKNIMLDVGHNEMAARAVLLEAKKYFKGQPFILIYNSYKDKEIEKILRIFKDEVVEIIVFVLDNPRIVALEEIEAILKKLLLPYRFFYPHTRTLDELSKNLIKSDAASNVLELDKNYLVFGSFSLAEIFLQWFNDSWH